jgi:hypothetical protein
MSHLRYRQLTNFMEHSPSSKAASRSTSPHIQNSTPLDRILIPKNPSKAERQCNIS